MVTELPGGSCETTCLQDKEKPDSLLMKLFAYGDDSGVILPEL